VYYKWCSVDPNTAQVPALAAKVVSLSIYRNR